MNPSTHPDDMSTVSRAPGWQPPVRRRRGGLVAAVVGGAVLVAAAVVATWLVARPASNRAAPAAAVSHAPTKVTGVLTLETGEFTWQGKTDLTCWGISGYDDIRAGATVTVTDAAGKIVALGALQPGVAFVGSDGLAERCIMEFTVTGVPGGVGPYGVEVTHRGPAHFAEDDLNKVDLSFH